jgi:hypothetical protein
LAEYAKSEVAKMNAPDRYVALSVLPLMPAGPSPRDRQALGKLQQSVPLGTGTGQRRTDGVQSQDVHMERGMFYAT